MRPYKGLSLAGILSLSLFVLLVAPAHSRETYISQEVFRAPWGSDPGQFGLIPEAEGVGPQSLCLDPQGNIYVLDLVNRQVQVFTALGGFLRQMPFGILAHDLCLGSDGELYLLAPYHGMVEKLDPEGRVEVRWPISPQIGLIDGIETISGQVTLRTAQQREHTLADVKGPLDPDRQLREVRMGLGGLDPTRRYKTQWINDHTGLVNFLDAQGKKLREVRVTTGDVLGSLVFLGADDNGNVYLRAETFAPGWKVRQTVRKYSPNGTLTADFELPADGFTYIYRNLRVHQNGDLYQLFTDPEGVRVLRWHAAPEAEEGRR